MAFSSPSKEVIRDLSLLGLCCWLLYAGIMSHSFVNWDDPWLIEDNEILHTITPHTLHTVFFDLSRDTRMTMGAEYLPVRDLTVMLNVALFGHSSVAYLLVNVLIYMLAIFALYLFLYSLFRNREFALLAAFLFAIHPIHVEVVAWASGRKDALCLLFSLLSMLGLEHYLNRGQKRWLAISILCLACAMYSKYVAIVLIGYVALRMLWLGWFPSSPAHPVARLRVIGIYVASGIALFLPISLNGARVGMVAEPLTSSPLHTLFSVLEIYRLYAMNLFVPLQLRPVYEVNTSEYFGTIDWVVLGIFICCLGATLYLGWNRAQRERKRWPTLQDPKTFPAPLLFWSCWFVLCMAPVSHIVPIQNRMADRYILMASISFALLAAYLARQLWHFRSRFLRGLLTIVFVSWALISCYQVRMWENSIALWKRTVSHEPTSATVLYQLSSSYREKKKHRLERRTLRRLLHYHPEHEQGLNNMGVVMAKMNVPPQEVIDYYQRVLERFPGNYRVLNNIARLYLQIGELTTANNYVERAIKRKPSYCNAYRTAILIAEADGRLQEAQLYEYSLDECRAQKVAPTGIEPVSQD